MEAVLSQPAQTLVEACLAMLPVNDAGKICFAAGRKPVEYVIDNPACPASICWEAVHELRRRGLKAVVQFGLGEPFIRMWSEVVLDCAVVLAAR